MPALALFGLGHGAAITTAFTAAGAVIPRRAHSSGFGFLSGASLIASAVSPVMSGLLAARSIRLVFVFGVAGLGLLAIVVRRVMVQRGLTMEAAPAVDET
jgi:MFS family permease